MRAIIFIFIVLISFSFVLTIIYWRKQRKLLKMSLVHKSKTVPKFDLIEFSPEDEKFSEFYEPKIIEVLSSDEV